MPRSRTFRRSTSRIAILDPSGDHAKPSGVWALPGHAPCVTRPSKPALRKAGGTSQGAKGQPAGRGSSFTRAYSALSTTTGSTAAALMAGTTLASSVTPKRTAATVTTSRGLAPMARRTPISWVRCPTE